MEWAYQFSPTESGKHAYTDTGLVKNAAVLLDAYTLLGTTKLNFYSTACWLDLKPIIVLLSCLLVDSGPLKVNILPFSLAMFIWVTKCVTSRLWGSNFDTCM
jgi:hypothetical protein